MCSDALAGCRYAHAPSIKARRARPLPYFNRHSFRKTLVALGERCCQTPEEFKAWSQNLGHEDVLTTFYSYGAVRSSRQAEIIRDLGRATPCGAPLSAEI